MQSKTALTTSIQRFKARCSRMTRRKQSRYVATKSGIQNVFSVGVNSSVAGVMKRVDQSSRDCRLYLDKPWLKVQPHPQGE